MPHAPYKPDITKRGQPYFDEAIRAEPKPVANAIAEAFKRTLPRPVVGFNRVPLIWKRPR